MESIKTLWGVKSPFLFKIGTHFILSLANLFKFCFLNKSLLTIVCRQPALALALSSFRLEAALDLRGYGQKHLQKIKKLEKTRKNLKVRKKN
jgi:hypothetical protein